MTAAIAHRPSIAAALQDGSWKDVVLAVGFSGLAVNASSATDHCINEDHNMTQDIVREAVEYWLALNAPSKHGSPEHAAAKARLGSLGLTGFIGGDYDPGQEYYRSKPHDIAHAFSYLAMRHRGLVWEQDVTGFDRERGKIVQEIITALAEVQPSVQAEIDANNVNRAKDAEEQRRKWAEEHAKAYKLSDALADGKVTSTSIHWLTRYGYKGDPADAEAVIAWLKQTPHADVLWKE